MPTVIPSLKPCLQLENGDSGDHAAHQQESHQ
jgi:hypothetical protein